MRRLDRLFPFVLLTSLALAGAAPSRVEPKAEKTPAKARPADPYRERFRQLDRNGDGYVTGTEWPLAPESFKVVDRNQDGRLSAEELLTPNRPLTEERRFQWLDADGDGLLSPSELRRGGVPLDNPELKRLGALTLRQYADLTRRIEDRWSTGSSRQDQFTFRTLDRNQDNRLNPLEWRGPMINFDRLDRNRDGILSPSEWP
jgi:hypothetical protein